MKRDASPGSMHDAGCLGLVHWDDPEGWYGGKKKKRSHMSLGQKTKKKKKNDQHYNDEAFCCVNVS